MEEPGRSVNSYSYSNKYRQQNDEGEEDVSYEALTRQKKCKYIWAKFRADVRVWLHHKDGGVAWDMWIMFLCFMSVIIYMCGNLCRIRERGQIVSLSNFSISRNFMLNSYVHAFSR